MIETTTQTSEVGSELSEAKDVKEVPEKENSPVDAAVLANDLHLLLKSRSEGEDGKKFPLNIKLVQINNKFERHNSWKNKPRIIISAGIFQNL